MERSLSLVSLRDPGRIRTCDPQLRRLLLYPTELRDQLRRFFRDAKVRKKQICPIVNFGGTTKKGGLFLHLR